MPKPLEGHLIPCLNDEYRSAGMPRSRSTSIDDAFDGRVAALDPQTCAPLLETAARLDAVSVFVEILKTAIKHAEEFNLADISRLLNR
jgi:hypothetical protein